ncbi:MAG: aminotransferase [Candidatus Tectimicrobiota bacterium]|nr:MAG: aminotransferase [Candidatus Tectomicrobia bacterium]
MAPEPRPELLEVPDVVHGALDFAELERLGLAPEAVLDFSVNGNPYGPSPRVRAALATVALERYPDRQALALRRELAQHLDVPPSQILVGNGSAELLWLAALAFLRPGDAVYILGPTFGEYERVARLLGARVQGYTAAPAAFHVDPQAVAQELHRTSPRLVFVCNPNNPTGTYLPCETIAAWAGAFPQSLFVVDEAYLPFVAGAASVHTLRLANVLALHSMTKAYALAGLRLGYALGPEPVVQALAKAQPPWSVNALAQAAGRAALSDQQHLRTCLARLAQAKGELVRGLQALGLAPLPSATHFFLVPMGNARRCRQALLRQGILVRDCTSFGLPAYIRIATRTPADNARLLAALQAYGQSGVCHGR